MIEMFRSDTRQIPPPWVWNHLYGQVVLDPVNPVKLITLD
jgi:hypothetical protein